MAYLGKPFFCFLLLALFSSLQIQARESKFFSKFIHISTNKQISESKVPPIEVPSGPLKPPALSTVLAAVPTPAPAPAFAPTFVESEKGYGLYGNVGSKQFTPTKGTETVTDKGEVLNEELSAENYERGNQNSNYNNNVYTSNYNSKGYTTVNYNNNGYSNNFNTNGYETEKQGMSDARFMENYETANNNNNNGYANNNNNNGYANNNNNNGYANNNNNGYANNYNNNGYTNNYNNNGYSSNYNTNGYETDQKQGMSDTRYYLNGRYFYAVQNERNPTGYESERQNEGYRGNTQNVNEFNTMEEYEKQQGYQQNQENYAP